MSLDLSGVSFPFSVGDAVQAAMTLLGTVDQFVLLGIAFVLIPALIGLVAAGLTLIRRRRTA